MPQNLEEFPLSKEAVDEVNDLHEWTKGNENWKLLSGNVKKWKGQDKDLAILAAELLEIAADKCEFVRLPNTDL
jgi:hypothetical protein